MEVYLTEDEKTQIKAVSKIAYDHSGGVKYLRDLKRHALSHISERLLEILQHQKTSLSPHPYIIFKNLPFDAEVSGVPQNYEDSKQFKSSYLSENILMLFSSLIGEPYSIAFEGADIVNNLIPFKEHESRYTGLGSKAELDFHIENAALRFSVNGDLSPKGLLLTGVRPEPLKNPKTMVSDARAALKRLCDEDVRQLYGKNFIIRVPYRWRDTDKSISDNTELVSLISGPIDNPSVNAVFYPGMILAVNDKANQALDKLKQAIKDVSIGIEITPGTLVYIDNRIALHARESFTSTYDANGLPNRWVQRVFITDSLWSYRHLHSVKARVFDPTLKSECVA